MTVVKATEPALAPKATLPGVIDTLSAGYKLLNRHPYLLALPVVLDLFYWLGPRLSVAPVARQAAQALEQIAESPAVNVAGSQSAQYMDMLRNMIENAGKDLNLFSVLSTPLSVPTLLVSQDLNAPASLGGVAVISITTWTGLVGAFVLLFLVGVVYGAF